MKTTKTIIPIAVVAIFLTLAFAPAASATDVAVTFVPKDGTEYYTQIVQVSDTDTLKAKLTDLTEYVINAMKNIDWQHGKIFSDAEKQVIKAKIDDIKSFLGIPTMFTAEQLLPLLAFDLFRRNLVCTIGWGTSLMPFNKYEAGARLLPFLKPIRFLMTPPSHTGYWKIFPGIEYGDKAGVHTVCVHLLQGIYIDGGSLGRERLFGFGIVFMLGRGFVTVHGLH